jgi:hypothetical protein
MGLRYSEQATANVREGLAMLVAVQNVACQS